MTPVLPQNTKAEIRSFQYRDLDAIEQLLLGEESTSPTALSTPNSEGTVQQIRRWYGLFKLLSWFPNPFQYQFCAQVAEQENQVVGTIQISPFNRTRSTWRVHRVAVHPAASRQGIGSQLVRHCLQAVREARTWLLEVDVNEKDAIALYRQNGFQPLAQQTYWAVDAALLRQLAEREPDLPNLLPVSNADAQLLYQLDTVAMPPLVRQVYDRHIDDFKTSLLGSLIQGMQQWLSRTEVVSGYVFEQVRKAAIGYFQVRINKDGSAPYIAQLTVHPAYTWLYPEILSQMARIVQDFPEQSLLIPSADYQPEREEYLERLGATRVQHTMMMSRSVWHKLRESKPVSLEGLQLSDVLQSLQPARKPVPGRMSLQPMPAETNPDLLNTPPAAAESTHLPNNGAIPPTPPAKNDPTPPPPRNICPDEG
ncbi:MAG: GNAT family N-acetyltransferase [Desertifilum sp. SIO1I2]|nr:GNAT family N-acetyltransferase [Desertifilum sp. SIO1I2]